MHKNSFIYLYTWIHSDPNEGTSRLLQQRPWFADTKSLRYCKIQHQENEEVRFHQVDMQVNSMTQIRGIFLQSIFVRRYITSVENICTKIKIICIENIDFARIHTGILRVGDSCTNSYSTKMYCFIWPFYASLPHLAKIIPKLVPLLRPAKDENLPTTKNQNWP